VPDLYGHTQFVQTHVSPPQHLPLFGQVPQLMWTPHAFVSGPQMRPAFVHALGSLHPHIPGVPPPPHVFGSAHAVHVPVVPQAALSVPATQLPFVAAVQHPPLHGSLVSHVVPQVWFWTLHAVFAGQSAALLHPQTPPFMHTAPFCPVAQSLHEPVLPQAVFVLPGAHVLWLQHPPLHESVASHALPHLWVMRLHAVFAGQSAAVLHAHAPFEQMRPSELVVQSRQTIPLAPHAALSPPATHDPA
jgi:hypothetical protein